MGGSQYSQSMEKLVGVVQELSLARDLDRVMAIVRRAARELTGADGATFVLREGDKCHYAEENAIAPLWKGLRFPMEMCISGWVMLNRKPAAIEDIYQDPRIPADAYRPTFVKSLVMVPIRTADPVGAIGNYWAERRQPLPEEVKLLQALADTTSVAMENVRLYAELEARVADRTARLEAANRELSAFAHAASHDLRDPLRKIMTYGGRLRNTYAPSLDGPGLDYLDRMERSASRMHALIDSLLAYSHAGSDEFHLQPADLREIASEAVSDLEALVEKNGGRVEIAPLATLPVDAVQMRRLFQNLIGNGLKYARQDEPPLVRVSGGEDADGTYAVRVKDNGIGIEARFFDKIFLPFQRLHGKDAYDGTGLGLALAQRIAERHGGRIEVESEPGQGTTFTLKLPVDTTALARAC